MFCWDFLNNFFYVSMVFNESHEYLTLFLVIWIFFNSPPPHRRKISSLTWKNYASKHCHSKLAFFQLVKWIFVLIFPFGNIFLTYTVWKQSFSARQNLQNICDGEFSNSKKIFLKYIFLNWNKIFLFWLNSCEFYIFSNDKSWFSNFGTIKILLGRQNLAKKSNRTRSLDVGLSYWNVGKSDVILAFWMPFL